MDILNLLLSVMFGVVSTLAFFGVTPRLFKYRTWKAVLKKTELLAHRIADSGYRPDIIVAIEGGGVVVAELLVTNWGSRLHLDKAMFIVQRQYYTRAPTGNWLKHKFYPPDPQLLAGRRVLLVDSVSNTGDTLKTIKSDLLSAGPSEIRTAAVYISRQTAHVPDFYADRFTWVGRMPWAQTPEYNGKYNKLPQG